MMMAALMYWLLFDTERAKLAKGRFLGAGRKRHFPWGVLGIAIWLSARAMARSAMAMMLGREAL